MRSARRDAANSAQKQLRDRIEHILGLRKRAEALEKSLAEVAAEIPCLIGNSDETRQAAEVADRTLESAAKNEQQAREAASVAQLAQEYAASLEQRDRIAKRLADLELTLEEIRTATERKASITAPSDVQIRELRSVIDKESDAMRRLEMARITVGFTPEKHAEIEVIVGEQPGKITCARHADTPGGAPNLTFRSLVSDASKPADPFPTTKRSARYWIAIAPGW